MKLYRNLFVVLLVGVGLLSVPFQISAQTASFTFVKIADQWTRVPGGTGLFTAPSQAVMDGTSVAFLGRDSTGESGIYTHIAGSLDVVADTNTTIPGTLETFAGFGSPSIAGGSVAFFGESWRSANAGIYTDVGGSLQVVADRDTAVPGTAPPVLFSQFGGGVSLDNGSVAFVGHVHVLQHESVGLYTSIGGNLNVVADTNTPIPSPGASGNFVGFRAPSSDQNVVAFLGIGCLYQGACSWWWKGIYTSGNVVANLNTAIPGTGASGNFTDLGNPSMDWPNVAFVGLGSGGQSGVYTYKDGNLNVVADTNTAIPDMADQFIEFPAASMDNDSVAFMGRNSLGQLGLYLHDSSALHKVVDLNDTLDGKALTGVYITEEALSGGRLVFTVDFADGTRAIYLAIFDGDTDGDGLPDDIESSTCTDQYRADTDEDGLYDGLEDANLNGITDANETNPCKDDTDADGLPDGLEVLGLHTDDDGQIDVDLPAMGADPLHQDIFVEIDFMDCRLSGGDCYGDHPNHTHQPKVEALEQIVEAFENAPVDNPDGTSGIHLHVDAGPSSIMDPVTGATWGLLSEAEPILHEDELGGGPNLFDPAKLMAIKALNFPAARNDVFYYGVFAHNFDDRSGAAWEADFAVAMGRWENSVGTATRQAGTFMHELGHNLGLHHGGDQGRANEFNFKPNYLSVMNYAFTAMGLIKDGTVGNMDYSRFGPTEIPDLNEANLNETVGLGADPAVNPYGTHWSCDKGGWEQGRGYTWAVNGPINWNCNGQDPGSPDFVPEAVVDDAEINGWTVLDGPRVLGQTLKSSNDWANLSFDGKGFGLGFPGEPEEPTAVDEMTKEIADAMPTPYAVAVGGSGSGAVEPGSSDVLLFTVENTGETVDTYVLTGSSSRGWADLSGLPANASLGPGEEATFTVNVEVPAGADIGEEERTKLLARSDTNPKLLDSHIVTTRVVLLPDTDNDGIPDERDGCPASDLSPEVVIDGCETGVDNHLLSDGCTISDRIAECAAGAKNHGKFVSCVARPTNTAKRAGIITGQQKGAIQGCAAQADIP